MPKQEGRLLRNGTSPADFCDVPSFFFDEKGGQSVEYRKMIHMETILEHEVLDPAVEYMEKVQEVISESTYWQLKMNWETMDVMWSSSMWVYFCNLAGSPWSHYLRYLSPLKHAKFESWRHYGFAIWSTARMTGYGLLLPTMDYAVGLEVPYYEAWSNLLTEDERESLDKENKRLDVEGEGGP